MKCFLREKISNVSSISIPGQLDLANYEILAHEIKMKVPVSIWLFKTYNNTRPCKHTFDYYDQRHEFHEIPN